MASRSSTEDALTRVFPELLLGVGYARLRGSSTSLASTAASLSTDNNTEYSTTSFGSSRSTIRGPGMVAGRGIKKLGEVALRGIEIMVIRRKISAVDRFFPYKLSQSENLAEQMCGDALELARLDYYSHSIHRRALKAILTQVIFGDSRILLDGLTRWPFVELRLFIYSLLSASLAQIIAPRTVISYLREGPVAEVHWTKLYLFFQAISERSDAVRLLFHELDFHSVTMRYLSRHVWRKDAGVFKEAARDLVNQSLNSDAGILQSTQAIRTIIQSVRNEDSISIWSEVVSHLSDARKFGFIALLLATPCTAETSETVMTSLHHRSADAAWANMFLFIFAVAKSSHASWNLLLHLNLQDLTMRFCVENTSWANPAMEEVGRFMLEMSHSGNYEVEVAQRATRIILDHVRRNCCAFWLERVQHLKDEEICQFTSVFLNTSWDTSSTDPHDVLSVHLASSAVTWQSLNVFMFIYEISRRCPRTTAILAEHDWDGMKWAAFNTAARPSSAEAHESWNIARCSWIAENIRSNHDECARRRVIRALSNLYPAESLERLFKEVSRWPIADIQQLLADILSTRLDEKSSDTVAWFLLRDPFVMRDLSSIHRTLVPFFVKPWALDMITRLMNCPGPLTAMPPSVFHDFGRLCNAVLYGSCTLTVEEKSCNLRNIRGHPLLELWPAHIEFFLRPGGSSYPRWNRQDGWCKAPKSLMEDRLTFLERHQVTVDLLPTDSFHDICVDLLGFSGYHHNQDLTKRPYHELDASFTERARQTLALYASINAYFRHEYHRCYLYATEKIRMEGVPRSLLNIHAAVLAACPVGSFDS